MRLHKRKRGNFNRKNYKNHATQQNIANATCDGLLASRKLTTIKLRHAAIVIDNKHARMDSVHMGIYKEIGLTCVICYP